MPRKLSDSRISGRSARLLGLALAVVPQTMFGAFAAADTPPTPTLESASGIVSGYGTTNASFDVVVNWDSTPYGSTYDTMQCWLCTNGTVGPWTQFPQTTYAFASNMEVDMGGVNDNYDGLGDACHFVALVAVDTESDSSAMSNFEWAGNAK